MSNAPQPQNPYGIVAAPQVVQPNLGEPTASSNFLSDIGNAVGGTSAYANAGQFGGNNITNQYAQNVSALGAAQGQQAAGMGQQANASLGGQGANALTTFQQLGNGYAGQAAPQANLGTANTALGNQDSALAMYQQAAAGNGPSAAQAQLQSGLQQSLQAQAAAAASARGGAGLANAQHDASIAGAQLQGQAANAAVQLRAQEQQAGLAGYSGLASTIQGQQAQNAFGQAGINQTQLQNNATNQLNAYGQGQSANNQLALGGAQTQLGYNQLGQGTQLGYNQLGQGALSNQLSADVASQQSTQQAMTQNATNQQKGVGSLFSALGGAIGL